MGSVTWCKLSIYVETPKASANLLLQSAQVNNDNTIHELFLFIMYFQLVYIVSIQRQKQFKIYVNTTEDQGPKFAACVLYFLFVGTIEACPQGDCTYSLMA